MTRLIRLLRSVFSPRAWLHLTQLVHYYNYSYVTPMGQASVGRNVAIAPNVSLRNGSRISIGDGAHVGTHCFLWAGDASGKITICDNALLAPQVFITASNYEIPAGLPVMDQRRQESHVTIGANTWIGAGAIILPGVTVGDGCVVGAGAVVIGDLPPDSIAVGVPARVVGNRPPA